MCTSYTLATPQREQLVGQITLTTQTPQTTQAALSRTSSESNSHSRFSSWHVNIKIKYSREKLFPESLNLTYSHLINSKNTSITRCHLHSYTKYCYWTRRKSGIKRKPNQTYEKFCSKSTQTNAETSLPPRQLNLSFQPTTFFSRQSPAPDIINEDSQLTRLPQTTASSTDPFHL